MIESLLMRKRKLTSGVGNMPVSMTTLTSSQFTTAANLRTLTGLSAGTNSEPGTWLRFVMDNGAVLVVPKLQTAYNLTGTYLNSVGLIKGTKVITVAGNNYKVRLMRCSPDRTNTMALASNAQFTADTIFGSEWYNIWNSVRSARPAEYTGPHLAEYTDAAIQGNTSNGTTQYCYEGVAADSSQLLACTVAMAVYTRPYASGDATRGWRPVLELVP